MGAWIDRSGAVGDALAAGVLGAGLGVVVVGDSTTVNLYKLAVAALDALPGDRRTILTDDANFPTDRYVFEGIAAAGRGRLRTFAADPVDGPSVADVEAGLAAGDVGLVSLSHVAYRSGARADLAAITDVAHEAGAMVLWDLSHSAGAVPVELDASRADLAVGCTYKYLNAGPGAPAFLYVRRDLQERMRQPLWGWFGQRDQFEMGPSYAPAPGIDRFLVGTPPILGIAAVEVGAALVAEAGIERLAGKGAASRSWPSSCPDHETRQIECKHLLAVRFTIRREKGKGGAYQYTREVEVTYTQQWSAYNAAQTNEKRMFLDLLSQLSSGVPTPRPHATGRKPTPLADMLFACTFKVYSGFSSRRFMSDLTDARERGLVASAPHFNSVTNYMSNPAITPVLQHLITLSALPLKAVETDFAVDSTGFSTSRFVRWYSKKWGRETHNREWVKLHAMTGVRTNVVTAAEVTGWTAADTNYFRPLLAATAEHFNVEQVSADKAYLSHANVDAVEKHDATPFIPFKSNTRVPTGDGGWERMYHAFAYNREAFLANHHKRSNVETTFSMIKAKFGDSVLSRSDTGQMNEALCKVLAHNLCCVISAMHELACSRTMRRPREPCVYGSEGLCQGGSNAHLQA